jgi:hypothetical protein
MRRVATVLICLWAIALQCGSARAQPGFDRPGGDYASFQVRGGDPAVCAARCERENRCRAWSFSYPGTVGLGPTCWLKSAVRPRVPNGCCISGVKGAGVVEPITGATEFSIDRWGGDYRNFEIAPDFTGQVCAKACQDDARCRAWTYLRPGYGTATARCYLKDKIKAPRRQPCCISGVVR